MVEEQGLELTVLGKVSSRLSAKDAPVWTSFSFDHCPMLTSSSHRLCRISKMWGLWQSTDVACPGP